MNIPCTVKMSQDTGDELISEALEKVLDSALFADVPRLSRFLEFVVSETLAGRGDRLKGFVIACEVFDKQDPSDAQTTTIVRVEAGRLRRRLADYYEREGSTDELRIAIPKGGYKPVFEQLDNAQNPPVEASQTPAELAPTGKNARQTFLQRNAVAVCLTTLVAILAIGAAYYTGSERSVADAVSATAGIYTTPVIAILPLEAFDENLQHTGLGLAITESLIAALSKRSDLHVMALSSSDYFRSRVTSVKDIGREMQVSHVIKGGYSSTQGSLHITITLHDAQSGYVIWSDDIETDKSHNASSVIDQVNLGISQQLGLEPPEALPPHSSFDQDRYALYVQARNLTHPPGNKLRVTLALGIFNTLIDAYPDFAEAYAGAAYAHSARVWWRHSELPEDDAGKTKYYAEKALDLDSSVGLAYLALGILKMADQEQQEAVDYLQQAVDVQPSNSLALAVLAMFKLWAGEPEGSVPLIEQAIRLDPLTPRTPYWNILGVVQFHLGNYEESVTAIQKNLSGGGPQPATQVFYLAASMVGMGRIEEARQLLQSWNTGSDSSGWQSWVYDNFTDKGDFDHLMSMLEPLGVVRSTALANN
jgi:adenylate cyclase